MRTIYLILLTAILMPVLFCGCGKKENDPVVILNLRTAYDEENNAAAKYEAYAGKADEAGYKSVAVLFRAVSRSEHVHAMLFADILKRNGIKPKSEVRLPAYVDVITSLRDGLDGETRDMNALFPEFLADAKAKKSPQEVIDSFQYALSTDAGHARLYALALNELEAWKAPGKFFVVCLYCGYLTNDINISSCPQCASEKSQFETFK